MSAPFAPLSDRCNRGEPVKIVLAKSSGQMKQARALFIEYSRSLDFDLDFQDFDHELSDLPGEYAPPDGRLLLALFGGKAVGCVALRKIESGVCEMKRLYVRPEFRGKGIGRRLAEAVIREACHIGYQRMRLDTVVSMTAANALYRSLGFRDIFPYCYNPIPGAIFLELDLTVVGRQPAGKNQKRRNWP